MRSITSMQYAISMSTLAVLSVTTRETIWPYFASLAVLMSGWFAYSLFKKKKAD